MILLDGIYLLKSALRLHYDLSIWIDCTVATALERAIDRQQEGLSRSETVRAYETICLPAQQIHFERDAPREAADRIVPNDPAITRLERPTRTVIKGASDATAATDA